MKLCFTFRAKRGREAEFEALLRNPEAGAAVAAALGATRNTLFLGGGRMVRVLEFPDDAKPRSMADLAAADPRVRDFLARLGPLVEDGFDPAVPESFEAFSGRIAVPLAYDVEAAKPT